MKINYQYKNKKDSALIFIDLLMLFKLIEKNKKRNEDNIVGILFHELMIFFVSNKCKQNLKKFRNIDDNASKIKFGFRNKLSILNLKKNNIITIFLFNIYSALAKFLNYKKTIFVGKSLSLSRKDKFSLFIFAFLNKYKLVLPKFDKLRIEITNETKIIFLKQLRELLIKHRISVNNLKDIKIFINKLIIEPKKYYKKNTNKNLIITGTLANIYNKILAIKKNESKLCVINHIPHFGFVSYKSLKYDEFYLCDYYLSPGNVQKKLDNNYKSIDNSNYKLSFLDSKNSFYFSDYVKPINFKFIKQKKILYVPTRTSSYSLNGTNYIYKKDYESWQNYLIKKIGNLDIKLPSKKYDFKINKKFKIIESSKKLLDVCVNYDLIIIDYISSTTFGEISSSNVPILYYNLNLDEINKNYENIKKKRVIEIKVNIFDNFKGFKELETIGNKPQYKNIFLRKF
jgi:hypothetical protein